MNSPYISQSHRWHRWISGTNGIWTHKKIKCLLQSLDLTDDTLYWKFSYWSWSGCGAVSMLFLYWCSFWDPILKWSKAPMAHNLALKWAVAPMALLGYYFPCSNGPWDPWYCLGIIVPLDLALKWSVAWTALFGYYCSPDQVWGIDGMMLVALMAVLGYYFAAFICGTNGIVYPTSKWSVAPMAYFG